MHTRIRLFTLVVSMATLMACGAANDGGYAATTDTVSTTGLITLSPSAINIVTKGPTVQSELIDECSISFETETLPYQFSEENLVLNGQVFEHLRPLATPESLPGIDGRLFAVWRSETATVRQVSYTFEVEIHSDSIIYRNTCVR